MSQDRQQEEQGFVPGIEYDIVTMGNIDCFIKEVNILIEKGWEPQGGVSQMLDDCEHNYFMQAVIRKRPMRIDEGQ